MLWPYFCDCAGSERLESFLRTMIIGPSKVSLDSALSKPTSTCCSSAVTQSFLTSCQYRICPNTGSPSISHLYTVQWWLFQSSSYITSRGDQRRFSVLYLFSFSPQPGITVNALILFNDGRKRFGSAGSSSLICSGF